MSDYKPISERTPLEKLQNAAEHNQWFMNQSDAVAILRLLAESNAVANDKMEEQGGTMRLLRWAKEMVDRDHTYALLSHVRRP